MRIGVRRTGPILLGTALQLWRLFETMGEGRGFHPRSLCFFSSKRVDPLFMGVVCFFFCFGCIFFFFLGVVLGGADVPGVISGARSLVLCPSYAGSNLGYAMQSFRDMGPMYKEFFYCEYQNINSGTFKRGDLCWSFCRVKAWP